MNTPKQLTHRESTAWLACLNSAAILGDRRDNESRVMATIRVADKLFEEWLKRVGAENPCPQCKGSWQCEHAAAATSPDGSGQSENPQ